MPDESRAIRRRVVQDRGVVQGVGFRPFVYNLATRFGLSGSVRNESGGVRIEVEGDDTSLNHFLAEVADRPPPLARIESLSWEPQTPRGDSGFRIDPSEADGSSPVLIAPDAATCADCLRELFDPSDRRYLYPFLNCTHCGPRLTIITGAPYDRPSTTMAPFLMCPACRSEYDDPRDRRFHAQPIACPACGPRLGLLDREVRPVASDDPLGAFASGLLAGKVGAMKGLGGFHLVCDARDPVAVSALRARKHREEKPFAVMVPDLDGAIRLCDVETTEEALLSSSARPIVLLRKRPGCDLTEAVAPGNPCLGVMLPYTPLHHLLMRRVGGVPLVMTSGNRSDEPIAYRDADALDLSGIADLTLTHDRTIHVRCDDSVSRVVLGAEMPLRRSRGYAPLPVALPRECERPTLAVGGQLKGTFALGRGEQAILSHHMGDLDHFEAFRAFEVDVSLYQQLFGIQPELLAHDLHPDYASTRYAFRRAEAEGLRLVGVQHHHAHMASCMAENGLDGPVIGVTLDGTGFGPDGAVWGGEFLVGGYDEFRRAAHLRYVGMPGGERAIREPWRMAAAHLRDSGTGYDIFKGRLNPRNLKFLDGMLERRLNSPYTSSAGRLFDAVASLACGRDRVSYEGQAAVELERLASGVPPSGSYPFEIETPAEKGRADAPRVVDTRPLIVAVAGDVANGVAASRIARRFHATLVELIATVCGLSRESNSVGTVVLSGGVFMNALLTEEVSARLSTDGFRVYRHRVVPPNDGGLSLGQLAVACRRASRSDV